TMKPISTLVENAESISYPQFENNDPNNMWFALESDDGLRRQVRVSIETGALLGVFVSDSMTATRRMISPNGAYMLLQYGQTRGDIWDVNSASPLALPDDTRLISPYFTPDNQVIVFHEGLSEIWLYNLATHQAEYQIPVQIFEEQDRSFFIDFSSDAQRILIVQQTDTRFFYLASVWNISDGTLTPIYEGNSHLLEAGLSNDGQFI